MSLNIDDEAKASAIFSTLRSTITLTEHPVDRLIAATALHPGVHELRTNWNDGTLIEYTVGDPDLDEEISARLDDDNQNVAIYLDSVTLRILVSSVNSEAPTQSYELPVRAMIAEGGEANLREFLFMTGIFDDE